jgi:hypothetical protein
MPGLDETPLFTGELSGLYEFSDSLLEELNNAPKVALRSSVSGVAHGGRLIQNHVGCYWLPISYQGAAVFYPSLTDLQANLP